MSKMPQEGEGEEEEDEEDDDEEEEDVTGLHFSHFFVYLPMETPHFVSGTLNSHDPEPIF